MQTQHYGEQAKGNNANSLGENQLQPIDKSKEIKKENTKT